MGRILGRHAITPPYENGAGNTVAGAFLQESLAREGFETWNGKTIDSIKVLKKILPGLPSYSLSYLREYFAVETRNGQAHRAFADAECMMKIFSIIVKQIKH